MNKHTKKVPGGGGGGSRGQKKCAQNLSIRIIRKKKTFAPNCAPIFDPLPLGPKIKIRQKKKKPPGEILIDAGNTKIRIRTP